MDLFVFMVVYFDSQRTNYQNLTNVIGTERPGSNLYSKTIPTNKYEYIEDVDRDGAIEDRKSPWAEELLLNIFGWSPELTMILSWLESADCKDYSLLIYRVIPRMR